MGMRPISQTEIESEILRLSSELEKETERYATLITDASKKESVYKTEWAKTYLSADGPVQQRQSWADYTVAELSHQYKMADALVKASKEAMTSLRTNLSALQTLAANLRGMVT